MKSFAVAIALTVLSSSVYAAPGPGPGPKGPTGPGYHEVTLATVARQGEAVESKVLLETPHLKLASLTLRQGATLAEHSAPMQVSIQALAGSGTVKLADGKTMRVEVGKMIVLAPNMAHSVVADEKTDLILLVHHLKGGGPVGRGPR
jgi:quercetin dioxygenase-like cupin family protein